MESEKSAAPEIAREAAEQIVADAISESDREQERKQQVWKVRILLSACVCGILYLACVGIGYLVTQSGVQGEDIALTVKDGMGAGASAGIPEGAWYESPVFFYVWAGMLVIVCGAAAIGILWKNETLRSVKIGRHKVKSLLTIGMDMLVVFLLHTYLSNIANNKQQLLMLPEAIPVNAYITTLDGSRQSGIFINDKLVQGFLDSSYIDGLQMDVRLKAGADKVVPGEWHTLNLYLQGVNCIEAMGGVEKDSVVWNAGEDASFLQGTEKKCIVSKKLLERYRRTS